MDRSIAAWLESKTGDSKRQMALRIGLQPSTFNRNLHTAEVIIHVCVAYRLNPVEALVEAGILDAVDVLDYADEVEFLDKTTRTSPVRIIDRIRNQLEELDQRLRSESLQSQEEVQNFSDPDYSKMSEPEAYDLAAYKGDENIAHDDLPHEP
ncbi:hypothetical protein [Arthrobacter sp. FW306-2-2C-D06B]|uniref:hypothetical protein n=1 Tax=Arthrobacter sp. FW306-2-2C-D06B TaxID=2879618 RepID=UPI001F408C83|nr:hypothetical protein [Arthrobacter sp. FW306-2-2C-D06B]UKA59206.1 hypothetical protein LFT47_02280 [Arthrobacter sp. FW306-2-2C-D06B]